MSYQEFIPIRSAGGGGGGGGGGGASCDLTTNDIYKLQSSAKINPFKFPNKDGHTVSIIFSHTHDSSSDKKAFALGKEQHKCYYCGDRLRNLYHWSDLNEQIFFSDEVLSLIDPSDPNYSYYKKLHDISASACTTPISGIKIINNESLFYYELSTGGFNHWAKVIPESDRSSPSLSAATIHLYEAVISRYITRGQMISLVDSAIEQGIDSFELLVKILDDVTYGKTFLPATRWLMSIVTDFTTRGKKSCSWMSDKEKYTILIPYLINSPIGNDMYDCAVAFFCQTGKQLIDLMKDAHDEDAMAKLCKARLDPRNYQRPTAEPRAGQVIKAIEHLEEFTNTVMQLSELELYHPNMVTVIKPNSSSSMYGFAKQLEAVAAKPKTFAEKATFSNIKTVDDLLKFAASNQAIIEIKNENENPSSMYLATTTLPKEKCTVPHFWIFTNKSLDYNFGISQEWVTVSHIVPLWKNIKLTTWLNVLFVLDIKKTNDLKNCCIPQFLSSAYSRICGTAFNDLNNKTNVNVPKGPLAAGYGASATNEKMDLNRPITVRINGKVIVINRLQ